MFPKYCGQNIANGINSRALIPTHNNKYVVPTYRRISKPAWTNVLINTFQQLVTWF